MFLNINRKMSDIDTMAQILATGANMQWISVEDRLPEYDQRILVYDTNANIAIEWFRNETRAYITHWMPLPEPPKQ